MSRGRLILLHTICWTLPFLLTFPIFMESLYTPAQDPVVFPYPGTYYCVPRPYSHFSLYLFYIPGTILIFFSIVNFLIAIPLMMWRNHHIFYFQWRTLIFAIQSIIVTIFSQILAYYFSRVWGFETIFEYSICVASHPRSSSPPCSPQYWNDFWYYSLFSSLLFGNPIVFSLYVYWSNKLIWAWWYVLLVEWKIPRKETVLSSALIT
jgi:hypothetical protein